MKKRRMVLLGAILLPVVMLAGGCSGAVRAKTGDTVKVHYTGTLEDGTVFDTSVGGEPLSFTLGQGLVIPGFDEAVTGLKVGESKTVDIPAEQAYGEYRDDLILVVPREQLPEGLEVEVGGRLQTSQPDGSYIVVTITEVSETTITVDANHRLAGQNLTFEIELVEIG